MEEWLLKLYLHIDRLEKKVLKRKKKKIRKLLNDSFDQKEALTRMDEHKICFNFKSDLISFCETMFEDFENLFNLLSIGGAPSFSKSSVQPTQKQDTFICENTLILNNSFENNFIENDLNNSINHSGSRLKGKFVSPNVFNLSKRQLSESEISLLSKGLEFIPTPKSVNRVKLKEELQVFGRKLRLKWHFRNEESSGTFNPFRRKSKFNPKGKDAAIEIYLSRLEEEILGLDPKLSYSNLSREERQAMQSLRDDSSIVIKEADKGSAVVVWDREDYLQEACKQLGEESTYEKIIGDCVSPLISTVKKCLLGINKRGDISKETLDYFLVDNPRLGRFYMLPKIHKRLFDVPGRPVISNSGYFTENISAFVDYHLQPLARQVKSYIKDTNDFLRKLDGLENLPKDSLMCTIDVVGLYPNIPHDEGIAAVKKALERRDDKSISSESLLELTELVLKNNIFEHNGEFFKQKQGTAIGTKMAPPYAILFMDELENTIIEGFRLKPYVWWRYIDDIFLISVSYTHLTLPTILLV